MIISNLQVLRAFAAILVVLYHTAEVAAMYGFQPNLFQQLRSFGAAGVDLFFVLSGFLMVLVQHRSPRSAADFLRSRILRIVPPYWFVTIVWCVFLLLLPQVFRESRFETEHALSSLLFISAAVGYPFPVVKPGWSLEFEMLFYALFAVGIQLVPKRVPVFVAAVLAIGIAGFGLRWIVVEFALGMLAAQCALHAVGRQHGGGIFLVGAFTLVLGFLQDVDGATRVLYWGLPSSLIVLGAYWVRPLPVKSVVTLGDASYAIYLTHTMAMPLVFKSALLLGARGRIDGDVAVVIGAITCVALGVAFNRLIEHKLTKWATSFYDSIFGKIDCNSRSMSD